RALSDIGSSRLSWAGVIRTSWASTLTFSMPLVASRPLEGSAGVVVLDMVTTARDFRAGNNKPIPLWAFTGRRLQSPRFAIPLHSGTPFPMIETSTPPATTLFDVRPLLPVLAQGRVLLTPNRRLASRIRTALVEA